MNNTWKENYEYGFEQRLLKMLGIINLQQNLSIVDVGCGKQDLLKLITQLYPVEIVNTVKYTGIDLYKHCNSTIVKDFNKHEKIEQKANIYFCSGIFEYIYDLPFFIENISQNADVIIGSYHFKELQQFKHEYWVNFYNKKTFLSLFKKYNFILKSIFLTNATEAIFVLYKKDAEKYINDDYLQQMKLLTNKLEKQVQTCLYKSFFNKKYKDKLKKLDEELRKISIIDKNLLIKKINIPRSATVLYREKRQNIGARSTQIAMFQMLEKIGINIKYKFDIDVIENLNLNQSIDCLERDILNSNSEKLQELITNIIKSHCLIINGEGSFIFNKYGNIMRFFLAIIKIAKRYKTKTYLINCEASADCEGKIQDENLLNDVQNGLKYVDIFAVRSQKSFDFAQKYLTENVYYVPDALFYWQKYFNDGLSIPKIGDSIIPYPDDYDNFGRFDFTQPYICISDSSLLVETNYLNYVDKYVYLINKLQEIKPQIKIYLVETGAPGKSFLNKIAEKTNCPIIPVNINLLDMLSILGHAELFISGRWHPSIMALINGTSCIFTTSNSHKTESLASDFYGDNQKVYSCFLENENDINDIIKNCLDLLNDNEKRRSERKRIKEIASNYTKKCFTITELIERNIEDGK